MTGSGLCGTWISYDLGLAELLDSSSGPLCHLVRRLERPPDRLYVRVNTLKIGVDEYLQVLSERGLNFSVDEDIPEAVWHPVEGPLKWEYRGKRVVADKIASESVLMGSDLYAPGVVDARGVERGDEVVVVSPNGRIVGGGVAAMSWREIRLKRRGLAVRITKPVFRAPRVSELPGFLEGLIYGQSITSMYVARALDPRPGWTIVDLNAAPGGKVSHVAQLVGPRSRIIAFDRPSKIPVLEETLRRLGVWWAETIGGDSRKADGLVKGTAGKVDAVLVDPPCTNIGVIPKVHDSKTLRQSIAASRYQESFIKAAYRLLKPGGLLAYSTCTLSSLENELVVARAENLGLRLSWSWGVKPSRGRRTSLGFRWEPHRDGTPGFFLAVLEKVG